MAGDADPTAEAVAPPEGLAPLLVRFFEGVGDRYAPVRDDPVLGPILARLSDRYEAEKRRHDFTTSWRVAMTAAVEEVLAHAG